MKSRIISSPKTIAVYNFPDNKLTALAEVCKRENIVMKQITPFQANCQVGLLCGLSGFVAPADGCENPPQTKCVIFSGFDRKGLDGAIDAVNSVERSALKAICTPTNKMWTLTELISELEREHLYMTGGKSNG